MDISFYLQAGKIAVAEIEYCPAYE